MSKRYKLHPEDTWRNDHADDVVPASSGITIEYRDVQETYTDGHTVTWRNSARSVKAPGKRTRVFIGELAWADAERLARDYEWEQRRNRW